MLLFEKLDLSPLRSILWKGLHEQGAGRPVEYSPECDLRALMLRQLEQIPYMKDLVKQLRRKPLFAKSLWLQPSSYRGAFLTDEEENRR